jgi:hypothetical protein
MGDPLSTDDADDADYMHFNLRHRRHRWTSIDIATALITSGVTYGFGIVASAYGHDGAAAREPPALGET